MRGYSPQRQPEGKYMYAYMYIQCVLYQLLQVAL